MPSPYDASEWTEEHWANRQWHIRYNCGLLGQLIQISVLEYHQDEYFERTKGYLKERKIQSFC